MPDTGNSERAAQEVTVGWLPGWARAWLQPRLSGWAAWAETVLFALLAILIGRWVSPDDPLFVQSQVPWSWLAPVLVAMRYGVLPGVLGAVILLAGWLSLQPNPMTADIPKLYFLGGLLLTMVCGEYSGMWRTRLRRISEINAYLEDRVERVTNRLYLLRLSHDRLEQDLLTRPTTLRDAITELRRRVASRTGEGGLSGAQDFLDFLGQYAQLEVAAIYSTDMLADRSYRRIASLGEPPALLPSDPLLAFAREQRSLAHIQIEQLDKALPTEHLVVAPITDSRRKLLGVLAVTRMPFFALNEDTLQTISVLLAAYADGVTVAEQVMPVLAEYPGCPIDFAEELIKLTRIQRDFGVQSRIVTLTLGDHPERADIYQHVLRNRRGPDVVWRIENIANQSFIITLMPIAGDASVEGYVLRMQNSLRENFGADFPELAVRVTVTSLSEPDPLAAVKRLMSRLPQ
jgi:hypothetical protein